MNSEHNFASFYRQNYQACAEHQFEEEANIPDGKLRFRNC